MPIILKDLKKENDLYKEKHVDSPILLDGLEPPEYVQLIVKDYKEQKEAERDRKVFYDELPFFVLNKPCKNLNSIAVILLRTFDMSAK